MSRPLNIISAFAIDEVVRAGHRDGEMELGGPARWIAEALASAKIRYRLYTPDCPALVRIVVGVNGEHGRIVEQPRFTRVPRPNGPCLISTVGQELSLSSLRLVPEPLALDVQGYVRTLASGKQLSIPRAVAKRIILLKTTTNEFCRLDPAFVTDQQCHRILITTNGRYGFVVSAFGKTYRYPGHQIRPLHTIGAGDTLFATFTATYFATHDVQRAACFSEQRVLKFLRRRA